MFPGLLLVSVLVGGLTAGIAMALSTPLWVAIILYGFGGSVVLMFGTAAADAIRRGMGTVQTAISLRSQI